MILVTGSAGFIGQAVCAATLLARGRSRRRLDNFNDYYDPPAQARPPRANLANRIDRPLNQ